MATSVEQTTVLDKEAIKVSNENVVNDSEINLMYNVSLTMMKKNHEMPRTKVPEQHCQKKRFKRKEKDIQNTKFPYLLRREKRDLRSNPILNFSPTVTKNTNYKRLKSPSPIIKCNKY